MYRERELHSRQSFSYVTVSPSIIEIPTKSEEKYGFGYQTIYQQFEVLRDRPLELSKFLTEAALDNVENVVFGLLAGILTDNPFQTTTNKKKCNQLLFLLLNLGAEGVPFIQAELHRLTDQVQKLRKWTIYQFLWIIDNLVKNSFPRIESILWNLLRNIRQGDLSEINRLIMEHTMEIIKKHEDWLYNHPDLVRAVVFTYLRILEDYGSYQLKDLKSKIGQFLDKLIRDRFADVLGLGRDLLRAMMCVSKVTEIEKLWQDILHDPQSLMEGFHGVNDFLDVKTPDRFLLLRIPPELETKLVFLTQNVSFKSHSRYLGWLQKDFLLGRESQTMRQDIIRYLVCCFGFIDSQLVSRQFLVDWLLAGTGPEIKTRFSHFAFAFSENYILVLDPILVNY